MKKYKIIILILLISSKIFGQEFEYLNPKLDDSCEIISKIIDKENIYEQLIYKDYKTNSRAKENLNDFKLTNERIQELNELNELLLEKLDKKPNKINLENIPTHWIPIKKYKGEYILYNSVEFNKRFIITDSSLISFNMDGINPLIINNFNRNDNVYKINYFTINWQTDEIVKIELKIYLIDFLNKIGLWEFSMGNIKNYELMISNEKITEFPIIDIYTTDLMGDEDKIFDEINYEKLIKDN